MFVIQVELEDEPPAVGDVDKEVQDAVNVGYQEGLLPEEETVGEQLHLRDNVMTAFNTIFMGYKQINQGFMELSKLIDGTPLHAMGAILSDIQESAARSAGYGGEEEHEGEAEEVRGRKKGREGAKHKRGDSDNDDTRHKISKRQATPKKRDSTDVQTDASLIVQEGPSHDLTEDSEIIKGKRKGGKQKVKKVGLGGILELVRQKSSEGARYYSCSYDPCKETTVSIEGMRSHIKQVQALFLYTCKYCTFTTKNFDSLKTHKKGCQGEYDSP